MPRKRMIDPNIWESEDFSKLTPFARLVFIGLFSLADDAGRGRAKTSYIKSKLFPYDDMRVADIDKALSEIGPNMSVTFYRTHDGNEFYSLDHWRKWQRVDKPSASMIPEFDNTCTAIRGTVGEDSCKVPGAFQESSGSLTGTVPPKGKEVEEKINIYTLVVAYLNEKAGTNFKASSQKTRDKIDARTNEGFTLEDFKRVIDIKCAEWNQPPAQGGKDMRPFLRPETLFGPKFEGYLNQQGEPSAAHRQKKTANPSAMTAGSSIDKQRLRERILTQFDE